MIPKLDDTEKTIIIESDLAREKQYSNLPNYSLEVDETTAIEGEFPEHDELREAIYLK